MNIIERYAELLVGYCLELRPGHRLLVSSTHLAEPLIEAVYKQALGRGAHPFVLLGMQDTHRLLLKYGNEAQLKMPNPFMKHAMEKFDAYINIMAPYNLRSLQGIPAENNKLHAKAKKVIFKPYFERTASGKLRRTLCQYPTIANAQEAGMSLNEYEDFVFSACQLTKRNPEKEWMKVSAKQEKIVRYLNKRKEIRFSSNDVDITFSTEGRSWINSDGKNNMPSGEVFTSPVEDSVNGYVKFSFPAVYLGHVVEGVELEVKNGMIKKWNAKRGLELLNQVFSIPGTRRFGEAAIGTNTSINRFTKNILFDEKIGGTIHMAVGQSYLQTGGRNQSSVHWDMIADMKSGGEIYADNKLIYKNGKFSLPS